MNAGIDVSTQLLKSDYKFGPTGSDTVDDAPLTAAGNATTFGAGNFDAGVTVFRYLDSTGKAVLLEDVAYQTFKTKGTELYCYERRGPLYEDQWAAADVFNAAIVVTDHPQPPADMGGYMKATIPLGVQDFVVDGVVAGA